MVQFVDRYRAKHGADPAIRALQAAFPGTPRSTAQRYVTAGRERPTLTIVRAVG